MKGLYWFRNDLRLQDNAALSRLAAQCDRLLCVYVVESKWRQTHYQSHRIGLPRWQFIRESLHDLQQQLHAFGQDLVICYGEPEHIIAKLIEIHQIDTIGVTHLPATEEQQAVQHLQQQFAELTWHIGESFTLFEQQQLLFELTDLPNSFTPFRKKVEAIPALKPIAAPSRFPEKIITSGDELPAWFNQKNTISNHLISFKGGATAALTQLDYYLHQSHLVSQYKQTRNGLDGWDFSSKLSPWLAQGCLSARQVFAALKDYEQDHIVNESTYWLYFELLWREYFQWLQLRHGHRLYHVRGIRDVNPLLTFYPEAFMAWKHGNTEADFVNAFMRQLQQTGWLSNRGRQIVASYLVNELGVDWRFGAAWFEEQLIDYDPASNWGNWQYLAGVGTDPRGRRAFNIAKQQQQYDPEGLFIARYLGEPSDAT